MKNFTFYILMLVSLSLFSQRGLQNNAHIRVSDGTVLKVSGDSNYGDFTNNKDMQNDGIVYISGNLTNNGYTNMSVPATSTEGLFILNGSTDQTINGSDSTRFENLMMDGAGVSLDQSIVLETKLTFNNGVIKSQLSSPVYFENGSFSTNSSGGTGFFDVASHASHVDGPVIKIGNESFVFPVGSGVVFRPASINDLSTYTRFTAEYFNENASDYGYYVTVKTGLHHVSSCEFWDIKPDDPCSASVALSWDDSSCGVNAINDLRVAHWYNNVWISEGNVHTTGDTLRGTILSDVVSSYSPFTLASISTENPLPVELGDVWLESTPNKTNIHWETLSEINNDYFTIEKSYDLLKWKNAGIIYGAGNSSVRNSYLYTDYEFNLKDDKYYRLKQTDFNGKYSYSDIMSVNINDNETLNNVSYSNHQGNLTIYTTNDSSTEAILEITSITGAVVYSDKLYLTSGNNKYELSENFDKGIYMISLKTHNSSKSIKVIL